MKVLHFLLWLLALLAVVVVPVLIEDWQARQHHQSTNPLQSIPMASMECNVALAQSPMAIHQTQGELCLTTATQVTRKGSLAKL
jgi:hypothetical protein